MANAASTIEIELEIREAVNRLGKLEGELKKSSSAMDRVANSTRKMESAFRSAKNAASALVAAISVQQIAQAADTFTNFANQIRIATNSAAEAAAVQKELYRVAQTTGTAIEDTTKLYARLRVAADQLGSSQAETIRITEIVAKSLAAAGTSSTEASGALLQLAQALNSPKVQAEEFNSLIDGMPNLLKEVEKQLGLTAGSLKKFVTDGNLTNQLFKDAILGSADAINEQFGAAQDTIATSLTRISNSFTVLIGKVEESTGIFSGTAQVMTDLAGEFDKSDGIVRDFAEGIKILGIAFDKLKQFAINLTKPLRDAFSMFTGGESNPIVTTINYIQAGFGFLSVAAQYEVQNAALQIERLTLHVRDFFVGMIANMFAFFEKVDNFFINQINKIIGYYNSAANAIGMDGDVAPIATSTEAQESALEFERDSAFQLADNYRRSADLATQYKEALQGVAAEFRGIQQQIDSGTFIKTEEQLADVDLEAANAASSVEKLKEKIEELEKIEYTDFTGQISEAQQEEFTKQLEEQFRIRTELGQLTEDQQNRFTQGLEEEFERVTEINALTQQKNDLYEASLFPKARELTYLEEATEQLRTQLLLQGQLSEEAERTADAIVSGISGAGPNASRATNIAQSKTVEEAAAKLILSNEKVAAAIDSSFELLFETIDPLIDILGDLISSINKLIGALLDSVDNSISDLGNQINLFNGTFTRGINQLAFDLSGGGLGVNTYNQEFNTSAQNDAMQLAFFQSLATLGSGFNFAPEIKVVDGQIVYTPGLQVTSEILSDFLSTAMSTGIDQARADILSDFAQFSYDVRTSADISDSAKQTMLANAEIAKGIILDQLNTAYFVEVSEQVQKEVGGVSEGLKSQIDLINFSNLTAEEQIEFRYRETQALLLQQKITAATIKTDEERLKALNAIQNAERLALTLMNKQKEELQKLNEERERELNLQNQNNLQSALIDVFKDFEKGLRDISEIIDGLNTQINDLLFSDFNLAPASDSLEMATETYGDLFAAALDPEATEEDVKAFQGFVDTYLRGARDVFKSSTAYRQIFDQVLVDLQQLGLAYGQSAPVKLIENIKDELESLETEFGTSLTTLIQELDRLGTVFANQSYAYSGVISVDLGTIDTTFDSSGFTGAINDLNLTIANTITAFIQTMDASKTALDTFNQTGTVTPVTPAPVMGTLLEQLAVGGNAGNFSGDVQMTGDYAFAYGDNSIGDIAAALVNAIKSNSELDVADFVFGVTYGQIGSNVKTVAFYPSVDIPQAIYEQQAGTVIDQIKYGFRRGGLVDPLDTIPAMLSPGEYILSPETVRRYGVSNLNRLNSGDTAALNATSDPEVKRLLAELIVAVKENDTEVNVYTDMQGQTKASIEEFRSELRERTRRQGDKFLPARYI
jgi:tape measure domain-containing protein